jgi:SAM-dependent methyltransferase
MTKKIYESQSWKYQNIFFGSKNKKKYKITFKNILSLLNIKFKKSDAQLKVLKKIYKPLYYTRPLIREIDSFILYFYKYVQSRFITKSGTYSKYLAWEKGWSYNLKKFKIDPNINSLTPKFVRKKSLLKVNGEYISPISTKFEIKLFTIIKLIVFFKYALKVKNIYEFGCGTGRNLLVLSRYFKNKNFIGLDYTKASLKILNLISKRKKNITGYFFDIVNPSNKFLLKKNSLVLTVGSLEQVGLRYKNFFRYLRNNKPTLVINFETINELYSNNNFSDYLSRQFVIKRNYLRNYLSYLKKKEKERIIKIIKVKRVFGSQFHEGYSLVIFKFLN